MYGKPPGTSPFPIVPLVACICRGTVPSKLHSMKGGLYECVPGHDSTEWSWRCGAGLVVRAWAMLQLVTGAISLVRGFESHPGHTKKKMSIYLFDYGSSRRLLPDHVSCTCYVISGELLVNLLSVVDRSKDNKRLPIISWCNKNSQATTEAKGAENYISWACKYTYDAVTPQQTRPYTSPRLVDKGSMAFSRTIDKKRATVHVIESVFFFSNCLISVGWCMGGRVSCVIFTIQLTIRGDICWQEF